MGCIENGQSLKTVVVRVDPQLIFDAAQSVFEVPPDELESILFSIRSTGSGEFQY